MAPVRSQGLTLLVIAGQLEICIVLVHTSPLWIRSRQLGSSSAAHRSDWGRSRDRCAYLERRNGVGGVGG